MKLLQMDFKSEGPWGEEMSKAFVELAEDISKEFDVNVPLTKIDRGYLG